MTASHSTTAPISQCSMNAPAVRATPKMYAIGTTTNLKTGSCEGCT